MISLFEREKRSSTRISVHFDLTYGPTKDEQTMTTGIEIGEAGMSFRSNRNFSLGDKLHLQLVFNAGEPPVTMEAEVKHAENDVVGVEFTKMTGAAKTAIAAILKAAALQDEEPLA